MPLVSEARMTRRVLGWKPTVTYRELCRMMVESDLRAKGLAIESARLLAGKLRKPRTSSIPTNVLPLAKAS